MKKVLAWAAVVPPLLVIAFFLIVPFLARRGGLDAGSYEYARWWRTQLLACRSLDDVKRQFNCFEIVPIEGGSSRIVEVTPVVAGRVRALIQSFPDGKWIACAYASSHGDPGGGTIVARDSDGQVHIFFGHVCGHLYVVAESLEEFYAGLKGYGGGEEKFIDQGE